MYYGLSLCGTHWVFAVVVIAEEEVVIDVVVVVSSGNTSNSSRHLALACSGLQFLTAAARQGRADPVPGRSAGQEGINWVLVDYLGS